MSVREAFPKPRLPRTHYYLTLARGDAARTYSVPVPSLYVAFVAVPVLCLWLAASTVYVVFHDDLLAGLMSRQVDSQFAYEDRLATMRAELDRVTSHQLLEQDNLGNRLADMSARQTLLEGRATMIASLAEIVTTNSHEPVTGKNAGVARPVAARPQAREMSSSVLGFSPVVPRVEFPALTAGKPRPENIEPDLRNDTRPVAPLSKRSEIDLSPSRRLDKIALSLEALEFNQVKALARLQPPVIARAAKLRSAMIEAGLSPEKLVVPEKASAVGGPFVPLKVDPGRSAFDREFASLQDAIVGLEKLRGLLSFVPLRAPLPGTPDITSSFGVRMDPFLGRPALHAGIDFRDEYGSAIHATAAGKVVTAGPSGGYGNMVEIEHGNGLSTRYGHMSAITVSEGGWVEAGGVVGRLGSTGRSTGPHLHYETRIDDEAVDPIRFLRAARSLRGTP